MWCKGWTTPPVRERVEELVIARVFSHCPVVQAFFLGGGGGAVHAFF